MVLLLSRFSRENPRAQVENRQRQGQAHSLANGKQHKVPKHHLSAKMPLTQACSLPGDMIKYSPSRYQANESKAASNFQQVQSAFQITRRDLEVGCRNESEEESQAQEEKHEGHVDAQLADHEEEADHAPTHLVSCVLPNHSAAAGISLHGDVVEGLRGVVRRALRTALALESGSGLMDRVLLVGERAPVGAVDDEDCKGEGFGKGC